MDPIPLNQSVTAESQWQGRRTLLVRCPELRPYFKVSCYEINMQTGLMFSHTKPAKDIAIQCQTEDSDLKIFKARFESLVNPIETERRDEDLPRIPLVQKFSAVNEVMSEASVVIGKTPPSENTPPFTGAQIFAWSFLIRRDVQRKMVITTVYLRVRCMSLT